MLDTYFESLRDRPCWGVQKGFGSFLTLQFGEPRLEVELLTQVKNEPIRRIVSVLGQWQLWIYCCAWSIRLEKKTIATWKSSNRLIDAAVSCLDGQILSRVSINPQSARTRFEFDLGGTLHTWPYNKDSEQWLLFDPQGKVLVLRADRAYRYSDKNETFDGNWQSIQRPHDE